MDASGDSDDDITIPSFDPDSTKVEDLRGARENRNGGRCRFYPLLVCSDCCQIHRVSDKDDVDGKTNRCVQLPRAICIRLTDARNSVVSVVLVRGSCLIMLPLTLGKSCSLFFGNLIKALGALHTCHEMFRLLLFKGNWPATSIAHDMFSFFKPVTD